MFRWNWNDSSSFPKIGELAFSERAIENRILVSTHWDISVYN